MILRPDPHFTRLVPRQAARLMSAAVLLTLLSTLGCQKSATVPETKGLAVDQARQALTAASLTTGKVTCSEGDVLPDAKIVAQSPAAGAKVVAGSVVDLTVEPGVTVPNLKGNNATDAIVTLQNAGLKTAFIKRSSLNVFGAGKISDQDIPPQTVVVRDRLVTLTVATPPDFAVFAPLIMQQPAYQKLSVQQRRVVDALLK